MDDLLSVSTLLVVGVLGGAVAGAALGFLWLTERRGPALGVWAASLWFGALACAFYILRPVVPDWTSLLFGNATLALAYGLIWLGFQLFEGGRPPVWKTAWKTAAGAVAWLPFAAVPFLRHEPALHAALAALVMSGYSLAIAWRLVQRRHVEPLPARLPTAVLFAAHGTLYALRVPLLLLFPDFGFGATFDQSPLFVAGLLEALLFTLFVVVAMLTLIAERDARRHRKAVDTDALTGLPNRHAFFRAMETLLQGGGDRGVLMLFDLDHFRFVNDRFGRDEGDRALKAFAEVLHREVRLPDVVARIGDEEFALFMPSIRLDVGLSVAEYLCRRTEGLKLTAESGERIPLTTSVGVAAVADAGADVEALMMAADVALAEAKRIGRNRARAYRAASRLHGKLLDDWLRTG
jgi:diguanylate cyclase (GGDEF)-like protein